MANVTPIEIVTPSGGNYLPAVGQQLGARSIPVVLASDIAPPLPTGAATAARQDTGNASLAAIDTKLGAALPLPTGAATAAKQDTGNASLAAIDTKLGAALPLPTGAATQATLAAIDTKLGAALPLPTGAATQATLAAIDTKLGAALPLPTGAATAALQRTNWSIYSTGKTPIGTAAVAAAATAKRLRDIRVLRGSDAAAWWLLVYDKASAPVAADTPVFRLMIPLATAPEPAIADFGPDGLVLANGLALAVTTTPDDATTLAAVSTVHVVARWST